MLAAYPLTHEGNEEYSRHVILYVIQLLCGIAFLLCTLCILKRKPYTPAINLVPFFIAATLVIELPLTPVLPQALHLMCTQVIIPELIATLIVCLCHFAVTVSCLSFACCYLLYQSANQFDMQLCASYRSIFLLGFALIMLISICEMLRRSHFYLFGKLTTLGQELDDLKSILGKLPEGIIIARRKPKK